MMVGGYTTMAEFLFTLDRVHAEVLVSLWCQLVLLVDLSSVLVYGGHVDVSLALGNSWRRSVCRGRR